MKKKLYLSQRDKKIAGVCGGIAEYFDVDSTLIRLAWIFFVLFGGAGIFLYIVAAIIMEKNPYHNVYTDQENNGEYEDDNSTIKDEYYSTYSKNNTALIIGLIFIFLGIVSLGKNFFPDLPWHIFNFRYIFNRLRPVILILIGISIIASSKNK